MSIISLVSGGLDSALMSLIIQEMNIPQQPININYGQLNFNMEYAACIKHCSIFNLPTPILVDVNNYGKIITSGITDSSKDLVKEAFLPNRNFLFLLIASSYAIQNSADTVAIGLLKEETTIYPDQKDEFLKVAEHAIEISLGERIKIITPLRDFYKKDIVKLAESRGITNYYSCHKGDDIPCGKCISCLEYN